MPERAELALGPTGRPAVRGRLIAYLASVYEATLVMVPADLQQEATAELAMAGGAEAEVAVVVAEGLGGVEFWRDGELRGVNAVG